VLARITNTRWPLVDPKDRWVYRLHNVWFIRISCNPWVYAWLVIYLEITSKDRLVKNALSYGLFPIRQRFETVKNILWDCLFAKSCWKYI
jgi:hypothetical protein